MSKDVATLVGSGTTNQVRNLLTPEQRGNNASANGGYRTGHQVVVANPEDFMSVDAFATSGISIGSTPVKIWGNYSNTLLPRQREVWLHNDGPNEIYIGPNSTSVISPSGYPVHFSNTGAGSLQTIRLPLMHNVEIWARAEGIGGAQIHILAF